MRNLFDQYSQPENRLTHALACTLHEDRAVLKAFLRWIDAKDAPAVDRLRVLEQRLPGEEIERGELTEAEVERRGLPDVCIFDDDAEKPWALLIESKVQAKAGADQLKRHAATVARRGFPKPRLLLVTVDPLPSADALPDGVITRQWRDIYAFLRRDHGASAWSKRMTEYMEIFETKMVAEEYDIRGTITMFDGLRFDEEHPYNYPEAKRLVRLLGDELRKQKRLREIGVNLDGRGRGAIKDGKGDNPSVWDLLPLKSAPDDDFTSHPHFTFYIGRADPGVQLSVPNGVKGRFRERLEALGANGFLEMLREIEGGLRKVLKRSPGAQANVHSTQRHWPSRSAAPIEDAQLSFDPGTVVVGGRDGVKFQPEWAEGMYTVLLQKQANIGLGFGVSFSYADEIVRSPEVVDLLVEACLAMRPALKLAAPEALR